MRGELYLPSGYAFAYTFGFTHSKRKDLWQGGALMAFGKALRAD